MVEIEHRLLRLADAGEVLTVQRAAFLTEARRYQSTELPPLVETLDDIRQQLEATIMLGAFLAARLVGAVRLTVVSDVGWISRVAIAPDQQGRGIGSGLLEAIEALAPPEVHQFRLAAGAKSNANIALYERRGYEILSHGVDSANIDLVIMGKDR